MRRRTSWRLVCAVVGGLGTPACSGGGGGGGNGFDPGTPGGTLSTGNYEITHWDGGSDGCRVNSNLEGEQIGIAVTGTALDWGTTSPLGPWPGVIHGSSFEVTIADQLDFTGANPPYGIGPYDCVLDVVEPFVGTVYGNDRALVELDRTVSQASGTECDTVAGEVSQLAGGTITFPCMSRSEFFLEKIVP